MENSVAIYLSGAPIYWHSIVIALAAAAALTCACILRRGQTGSAGDVLSVSLIGFLPAMLLARVYYCYFAQESFADRSEMFHLSNGGYALYGAMAGYLIVILVFCRLTGKKAGKLLDSIAPAAALGIAIGRAASYFSGDDFGRAVTEPADQKPPLAVFSQTRGEWNIAVFSLEAIAALVIFLLLILLLAAGKAGRFSYRDGDTMLMFMFLYGLSQTVFESMRNDTLFLISLGFVRISQIISIVMAAAVFVVFSVRSAKRGLTRFHFLFWFMCLVRIVLAFWMEFCITNETSSRNYTIMCLCLLFVMFIGLAQYFDSNSMQTESADPTPTEADSAPAELCSDIPVDLILQAPSSDGFPFEKAAEVTCRYTLRVRSGYPDEGIIADYPQISRVIRNVQGGKVDALDLLELMGCDGKCPDRQYIDIPDGYYHVTICVCPMPVSSGGKSDIRIFFARTGGSSAAPEAPHRSGFVAH